MNNPSDTKRLADAVANIAATIAEIIDARLKAAMEARTGLPSEVASHKAIEGWVKKADVAKHLNISRRTLDNWMAKGVIPYIRLGERRVFFKISEVDEAINRRFKRNGIW
jgi:excisionase family DNA binding protein